MILVFGSNGQLGQELLYRAGEMGAAITGLPRAETDIADRPQVEQALAEVQTHRVVDAAAYALERLRAGKPASTIPA